MRIIETVEQAEFIGARDLRDEALKCLAQGDAPGYERSQSKIPGYTGTVEVLIVGDRAGVVTNGNAVWGDVRLGLDNEQEIPRRRR